MLTPRHFGFLFFRTVPTVPSGVSVCFGRPVLVSVCERRLCLQLYRTVYCRVTMVKSFYSLGVACEKSYKRKG